MALLARYKGSALILFTKQTQATSLPGPVRRYKEGLKG